jgi:hypothetical protein
LKDILMKKLATPLFNRQSGADKPTIEEAKIRWYNPTDGLVVRISCIAEGNCLFHSFLRSTSEKYRRARSVEERKDISKDFRNQLAVLVEQRYDEFDKRFYLTKIGWTKSKLVAELKSNCFVGAEIIGILADVTEVNIHAVQLYEDGNYEVVDTIESKGNVHIILLQVKNHFENLVIDEGNSYRLNFEESHPFIQAIRLRKFSLTAPQQAVSNMKPPIVIKASA